MNAETFREAQALRMALDTPSQELLKSLAGRLRATGLRATLEWLDQKKQGGPALAAALRTALGLDLRPLRDLDNLSTLRTMAHATELVGALHLVDRAARRDA